MSEITLESGTAWKNFLITAHGKSTKRRRERLQLPREEEYADSDADYIEKGVTGGSINKASDESKKKKKKINEESESKRY